VLRTEGGKASTFKLRGWAPEQRCRAPSCAVLCSLFPARTCPYPGSTIVTAHIASPHYLSGGVCCCVAQMVCR
jgi:hypothetical protein